MAFILDGGAGDDLIVGDYKNAVTEISEIPSTVIGGNDMLSGGAGDDTFLFLIDSRLDVITDFKAGAGSDDVLDVTDYGIDGTDFETVLGEDLSGNAVLTFNADDKITLLGVDQDSLHFDDFIPI
jgi:Ca2+-binding RTX toxin-like protein